MYLFIAIQSPLITFRITAYLRLVVLAVGFQYAVKSGVSPESEVFKQSIDAARSVIQITIERLYPTGHLRYAMEANFLYVSFAAAYLVNVCNLFFFVFPQHELVTVAPAQVFTAAGRGHSGGYHN